MKLIFSGFFFLLFFSSGLSQIFDSTSIEIDTITYVDSSKIIFADSLVTDSLPLIATRIDTVAPLYKKPFNLFSGFISNKEILRTDYESTVDILKLFPLTFINEHGIYGYPDKIFLYGVYSEAINFLKDGLPLNNRNNKGFNLNLLQSELIDSVEIIKLPRAFLYTFNNYPVSLNFIEKDFLSVSPYTRIKYYEGPYGQALFDGIFNAMIFENMNVFIDITNRKGDESFRNTDFTSWQASAKLKYLFSNKFNLIGSFNYSDYEAGLNGGIDVDSIVSRTTNIEAFMYNEISAPVISLTAREKILQHIYSLRALWQPADNWQTDFKLYSFFDQNLLTGFLPETQQVKRKNYSYGMNLNQSYSFPEFYINVISGYERTNSEYIISDSISSESTSSQSVFFISPIASVFLGDSLLVPSVFIKYLSVKSGSSNNFFGYGFDINLNISPYRVYAGYSSYQNFYSDLYSNNLEAGISLRLNTFYTDVKIFSLSKQNLRQYGPHESFIIGAAGIGLTLEYKFWKLLLESFNSYYFKNNAGHPDASLPDYHSSTGIYFKEILFNNNLDLKSGFIVYLNQASGKKRFYNLPVTSLFPEINYRIDFTLSAVIRRAAIVYFTWENLSNNNYFIVPFYPMPERNIRFGISWELFN